MVILFGSDTNVADQDQVFGSLLETYRGLAKIRKSSPALTHGNYKTVNTTDPEVLAYIREDETETVLVTINLSEKNKRTNCNLNELGITSAIASDRIFNLPYPEITPENSAEYTLILPAYEGRWIKLSAQ